MVEPVSQSRFLRVTKGEGRLPVADAVVVANMVAASAVRARKVDATMVVRLFP